MALNPNSNHAPQWPPVEDRGHVRWSDGQPLFSEPIESQGPGLRSFPVSPWPDAIEWQAHYQRRRIRLAQLSPSNLRTLALAATDRCIALLDLELAALD